ncbi:carbohydrate ABC transporter permease [Ammoniphilus oxalaticus]|nr:sugar ABC transporter permease [Ammoniphilus oxalaticus]
MKRKDQLYGWLFVLPALLVLVAVILYPLLNTIFLSLQQKVLIAPSKDGYIGLDHYGRLLRDTQVRKYMINTLVFTCCSVALKMIIGMIGALLLNTKRKGAKVYWSIFMIPWLAPSVVAALVWKWILHDQFGILNQVLRQIGLLDHQVAWLSDPLLAFIAVVVVDAWVGVPFMIVVLLAGMQTIPREWYEAAVVDGANRWRRFLHITLPGLKPIVIVMGTISLIGTFNSFNIIYTMTGGGPIDSTTTMALHIHRTAFTNYDFGYASALSVVTFVLIMGVATFYIRRLQMKGER